MGRNFPSFHICLTVLTVKLELSLFVEVGESGLSVRSKKSHLTVLTVALMVLSAVPTTSRAAT